ncbi:MAG: PQQ-like beta-propeller repeat protein [Candidatus Latescibacteria bacterium]|nr:PQQ-like beta-propeller repeat protein [Candidatus Latescibacterota bacterium]
MHDDEIRQLKDLSLHTRLTGDSAPLACIVIPSGEPYPRLAQAIQRTVRAASGVQLPIRFDTDMLPEEVRQTNVIVLGNLADNRLIETLYYQWYTLVDRSYPGPGGYVLHTIHDPWGTGRNVIIVGASDVEGIENAAAEFQQRLPSTKDITLDRLHHVTFGSSLQPVQDYLLHLIDQPLQGDWGFGLRGELIGLYGLYYLISGIDAFAERFREGLLTMVELAPEQTPEVQVHLRFFSKMILWDLLEETPVFTHQDRLTITNYLLRVLRSEEGFANSRFQEMLGTDAPRQNHQTILATGLLFGGQYFDKYYHLPEAKEWLQATDRLFAVFARYFKPACDCSDHGWRMTIPTAMLYGMVRGDMASFANRVIRRAAECAIICCNNLGRMPALGDCDHAFYPTSLFAQAAHYYRDGRYTYMLRKRQTAADEPYRSFRLPGGDFDEFERAFDSGVEPREPNEMAGIAVAPLDAHYYEMPERYQTYARRLYGIPMPTANIPLSRTFDKISLRTGFSVNDQYMLIDGTGGGNHSYEDANAIVEFSQYGKAFLVTEDSLHWPSFRDHNVVTVTKDGLGATSPSFAGLEHAVDFPTVGFLRTSLRDYNHVDWFRNIIWVKGRYFVILDELVTLQPGDYAFQCHWKMIGQPSLTDGMFMVTQQDDQAFVKNADSIRSWLDEVDISLSTDHDEKRIRLRKAQYGLERLVAYALHQRAVRHMTPGDRLVFHNLLYASSASAPSAYEIRRLGAGLVEVTGEDSTAYAGVGVQDGAVQTDAQLLYVTAHDFALVEATFLRDDHTWFASDHPVSVEYSLTEGRGIVDAKNATNLTLPAGEPGVVKVDGQAVQIEHRETKHNISLLTVPVPAGRHLIETVPLGDRTLPSCVPLSPTVPTTDHRPPITSHPIPRWTFTGSSLILACHIHDVDADGEQELALGLHDGAIHLLNANGSPRWSYQTGGPVNSICTTDLDGDGLSEIVAGSDDGQVYALDRDGRLVWRYAPEFGYQHWPWWTQGSSKIKRVHADDLDGDGHPEIIAGVANMRLHVLDAQGRERWNARTDHGLFVTLTTADLNGDGLREIVGGMAIKAANSTCFVFDWTGRVQKTFTNHGWTSQLTALVVDDLDGDGRLEVACGINRGENLRVFDADSGALRWSQTIGDPITELIVYPSRAGKWLVAGSSNCYACAFDGHGEKAWICDLDSPVTRFAISHPVGNREVALLAGCDDGSLWMIDSHGQQRRCLPPLDGRITVLWSGTLRVSDEPALVIGAARAGLGVWSLHDMW